MTVRERGGLTGDKVLVAAVALADEVGIEALTIRRLAGALDIGAMTIYHYLPSKEAILDGMVDMVFAEIELPRKDTEWKSAMRARANSARQVLARHPWATPLMESRTTPGPATLRHHDAMIGCLRTAGFNLADAGHAYALIDSYVYGFALQEANLPATGGDDMAQLATSITEFLPEDEYPHFLEFTRDLVLRPGYDFSDEFEFGLDLILDGLEAVLVEA